MREIRRAEDAERTDPPHAAPVTAPDHPAVIRRLWSDLELPDTDDRDDPPIGGPLSWTRDAMDRALSPSAIDHRKTVEVDHPELPGHPMAHYDRPRVRDGEGYVEPPLWTGDGPRREDVQQGQLGDCWALSAMGAVAGHRPDTVRDLITEDGDGYSVRLHHARREAGTGDWQPTGNRVELRLTREVPHLDEEPDQQAGASVRDTGVAWVSVLEKAFAGLDQAWGRQRERLEFDDDRGYARMTGGTEPEMAEVLTQLTGERAGVVQLDRGPGWESRAERMLADQLADGCPIVLGTRYPEGPLPSGLERGHAYEVTEIADGYVRLRNPWGTMHPEPVSVGALIADSRGKIVTTEPDHARESYDRG